MNKNAFLTTIRNLLEPFTYIVLICASFPVIYILNHSTMFYRDLETSLTITRATLASDVVDQLTMGDVCDVAVTIAMDCIFVACWMWISLFIPGTALINMAIGAIRRRRNSAPLIDAAHRAVGVLSSERQRILVAVIDAFVGEDEGEL